MLVVTAYTPDYREMVDETSQRCIAWRYGLTAYKLDHSTDLEGAMPPCTFKPTFVRLGIASALQGELCAWLDADAIPLVPFAEALEARDFDLAVTLRESAAIGKSNPTTNYLNAGVIFLRNNAAARHFLSEWGAKTKACGNDQLALNRLVGPGWTDEDWRQAYNRSFTSEPGASVLILPAEEWNYWHFERRPGPEVKILHFKRGFRQAHGPEWWRRQLTATEGEKRTFVSATEGEKRSFVSATEGEK
jgi:hypothetical protein